MTSETGVTLRFWAAARAATGVSEERMPLAGPVSLAELVAAVLEAHPGERTASVIGVCSVLVDDQPVASLDPREVFVRPGARVEFLPPFAGG